MLSCEALQLPSEHVCRSQDSSYSCVVEFARCSESALAEQTALSCQGHAIKGLWGQRNSFATDPFTGSLLHAELALVCMSFSHGFCTLTP